MEWFIVCSASLLAGLIDAIVGGGGLVLVPALFATFPSAAPATLLGTNKGAATWGTLVAAWQFSRKVALQWPRVLPAALAAGLGALAGVWLLTAVSPTLLRKLLPVVLLLVLINTLLKKDLGTHHRPRYSGRREVAVLASIGGVLGFYDGFFGPGTGSFMVFAMVRWLGYDFLRASAHAKVLNLATNITALALLAMQGHVWWHYALPMAVANVVGSLLGARLAFAHGAGFVRKVFIAVVTALIAKTAWDAYF